LMHVPRFVGWSCWDQFLIRTGNCYPVSACVVSTRFLAEIGVFDVELKAHEDWDFWIRAIDEGARVAYVPPLMAAATLIRLRRGMSADAGLMKRTRAVVRRRHCTSWPGLLLLSGPVLAAVLALRTIVGLWECRVLGRRSNLT
jgi:GT2 family glycosyltransferase